MYQDSITQELTDFKHIEEEVLNTQRVSSASGSPASPKGKVRSQIEHEMGGPK